MTGKEFMDKLEGAFPGVIAKLFPAGYRITRVADEKAARKLEALAVAVGAPITPEIVAKARLRHGTAAFRVSRLRGKCEAIEHAPVLGDACACGEVHPEKVQPAPPQALGPQARILFAEDREPEQGPALPSATASGAVDLTDAAAEMVARCLYALIYQNTGRGNGAEATGVVS